jgi:5-methylcytosine-specific restriction endonuclease McrA
MVDHRVAHKGDPVLFWSRSNWQPMNRRCNSRKAASREGGFGNPIRREAETEIGSGVTLEGRPVDRRHPWNRSREGGE